MERFAGLSRTAIVKKCRAGDGKSGKSACLYSHEGRLLGAHKNKQDAYRQEAEIKANQS